MIEKTTITGWSK